MSSTLDITYMNADVANVIGGFLDTFAAAQLACTSAAWLIWMRPRLARSARTLEDLVRKHPKRPWDWFKVAPKLPLGLAVEVAPDIYRPDMPLDYVRGKKFENTDDMLRSLPISFIFEEGLYINSAIVNNPEFTPDVLRVRPSLNIMLGWCTNPAFNESNYEEFKNFYSIIHVNRGFSTEFKRNHLWLFQCCADSAKFVEDIDIATLLAAGFVPWNLTDRADFTIDDIKKHNLVNKSHITKNPNITPENLHEVWTDMIIPLELLDNPNFAGGLTWHGVNYAGKNSRGSPNIYEPITRTKYLGTPENVAAYPHLKWSWHILSKRLPFSFIIRHLELPWEGVGLSANVTVPYWFIDENISIGWDFMVVL